MILFPVKIPVFPSISFHSPIVVHANNNTVENAPSDETVEEDEKESNFFVDILFDVINFFLEWITKGIRALVDKLGISLDQIILGTSDTSAVGTNLFRFKIEQGNIYALTAAKIYQVFASAVLITIPLFISINLVQYGVGNLTGIFSSTSSGVKHKEALQSLLLFFLMICVMPYFYDTLQRVIEMLTNAVVSVVNGYGNASILDSLKFLKDQNDGVDETFCLLVYAAANIASIIFVKEYVIIAISTTVLFIVFPLIGFTAFSGSVSFRVRIWYNNMLSNLLTPLIDSVVLILPISFVQVLTSVTDVYAKLLISVIIVICCYLIIPIRKRVPQYMGLFVLGQGDLSNDLSRNFGKTKHALDQLMQRAKERKEGAKEEREMVDNAQGYESSYNEQKNAFEKEAANTMNNLDNKYGMSDTYADLESGKSIQDMGNNPEENSNLDNSADAYQNIEKAERQNSNPSTNSNSQTNDVSIRDDSGELDSDSKMVKEEQQDSSFDDLQNGEYKDGVDSNETQDLTQVENRQLDRNVEHTKNNLSNNHLGDMEESGEALEDSSMEINNDSTIQQKIKNATTEEWEDRREDSLGTSDANKESSGNVGEESSSEDTLERLHRRRNSIQERYDLQEAEVSTLQEAKNDLEAKEQGLQKERDDINSRYQIEQSKLQQEMETLNVALAEELKDNPSSDKVKELRVDIAKKKQELSNSRLEQQEHLSPINQELSNIRGQKGQLQQGINIGQKHMREMQNDLRDVDRTLSAGYGIEGYRYSPNKEEFATNRAKVQQQKVQATVDNYRSPEIWNVLSDREKNDFIMQEVKARKTARRVQSVTDVVSSSGVVFGSMAGGETAHTIIQGTSQIGDTVSKVVMKKQVAGYTPTIKEINVPNGGVAHISPLPTQTVIQRVGQMVSNPSYTGDSIAHQKIVRQYKTLQAKNSSPVEFLQQLTTNERVAKHVLESEQGKQVVGKMYGNTTSGMFAGISNIKDVFKYTSSNWENKGTKVSYRNGYFEVLKNGTIGSYKPREFFTNTEEGKELYHNMYGYATENNHTNYSDEDALNFIDLIFNYKGK